MGKYNYIRDEEDWYDGEDSKFLEAIANELAEMNRLKRLELLGNNHTGIDNKEEALKDRA